MRHLHTAGTGLAGLSALVLMLAPIPAPADRPCVQIDAQIVAARDGFGQDWEWQRGASTFSDAQTCSVSNTTTGPVLMCHWTYPYRSPEAATRFESLSSEVVSCLGRDAILRLDPAVNHPDSYALREYTTDGVTIAVSIKDKGAMQKTLVFFRLRAGEGH